MQINETQDEVENVIEVLKSKLSNPPRKQTRRSPFDIARSEVDRIRKNFQRKINTSWHPINSQKGIEAKLDALVQEALSEIDSIEQNQSR